MKIHRNLKLIVLLAGILILISCSEKVQRDDAVRIKSSVAKKYNALPDNKGFRSGSTLRGEVLKIEFNGFPDSCPTNSATNYNYKGWVLFVDSTLKKENIVEKIPLEDVDMVGIKMSYLEKNQYNNINYFETFNEPLLPLELREVPVDTTRLDTCTIPCPCEKINLDMNIPCLLCFECPERDLKWWFAEFKAGMGLYNDISMNGIEIGKDDWLIDVALGIRLGESKRWALGLMYSTNVETMNIFDTISQKRSMLALYGRYDLMRNTKRIDLSKTDTLKKLENYIEYDSLYVRSIDGCSDSLIVISKINPSVLIELQKKENIIEYEVRPCINPFVYGIFGASIDELSIDLFSINFNEDCQNGIDFDAPDVDISLPLDFGFGVGLDIPINKHIDFSTDLGFRSISYGDKSISSGLLIPHNRRLNAIVFRIGLSF